MVVGDRHSNLIRVPNTTCCDDVANEWNRGGNGEDDFGVFYFAQIITMLRRNGCEPIAI